MDSMELLGLSLNKIHHHQELIKIVPLAGDRIKLHNAYDNYVDYSLVI